jgi:hypothetical protein
MSKRKTSLKSKENEFFRVLKEPEVLFAIFLFPSIFILNVIFYLMQIFIERVK